VHITRCLTPRPHNSGEAPCSFEMAPCVVVERLEGKQKCNRAPVGEHAEFQAQDAECGCHEQQEVNEKRSKPRNSPSHNHDSTAPRQHPLIYTGAGSIHLVHGPLWSPTTERLPRKDSHFHHFGGLFGKTYESCHRVVCGALLQICALPTRCPSRHGALHVCGTARIFRLEHNICMKSISTMPNPGRSAA